ncbi:hypothetical protein B0I35DRAFT_436308 [Stachybotrys elegans]|uniref:Alpha/beta hydrolase fold-3 domain-containing protein n=1 Tax=Stachybotrys elegans TaxID=80388 RepID=A0A8K0SMQ6_9HYPO|nr:hypothetical protein B0I35DRAFT_436308 [Stachybotrys elegans]
MQARALGRLWPRRFYSSFTQEKVQVRCGSAGFVDITLYNVGRQSPTSPLLIHLPSFPGSGDALPGFFYRWPVASIAYRWAGGSSWPTPVHDVAFAYAWLAANLAPPGLGRRPVYVYGSYLGASLAVSLSLTESHPHARFGVRGVLAYNGVYNWTMFLPDHRVNAGVDPLKEPLDPPPSHLNDIKDMMPSIFGSPVNLFDAFASPSLFFHNPGLEVPLSFHLSAEESRLLQATENPDFEMYESKPPRKSHLVFPPRQSTLKIPEACLMHTLPPEAITRRRKAKTAIFPQGHTFGAQAAELTELMRRSVEKIECKERSAWDDEERDAELEALKRVEVVEVGKEAQAHELTRSGHKVAQQWLQDRMQGP